MGKDIVAAVREICFSFPEAEAPAGKGSGSAEDAAFSALAPDFKVRGKPFATLAVNHHGDGRIALWVNAPPGAQALHVEGEERFYFVPPYVGTKGWLGVHLDRGNDWLTIATRVREAYVNTAPAALAKQIGETIAIEPPTETVDPEVFDPLSAPHAQEKLVRLRALCAELPETVEATQFGAPAFKAGKRTFLVAYRTRRLRFRLEFWVGAELQATLTDDPRFEVPRYIGHRGWIDLDIEEHVNWQEVRELVLGSYRHFALKRMLKALDGS